MAEPQRKTRLDRAKIISGVLTLSAATPHSPLTVKRLGVALGVDASAVYRHFPHREALVQASLDELFHRVLADEDAPGTAWRRRLEAHAGRCVDVFLAHPSVAQEVIVFDTRGLGEAASIEFLLTALHDGGLRGSDLHNMYAAFSTYLLSQIAGLAREIVNTPGLTPHSPIPWVDELDLSGSAPDSHLRTNLTELVTLDRLDIFWFGLGALLDQAEAIAAR